MKNYSRLRFIPALTLAAALATTLSSSPQASDEVVMLSPFIVSSDGLSGRKPPITIKKKADYLLLEITLANDSREPERRREEIYATLADFDAALPTNSGVELYSDEFQITPGNHQVLLDDNVSKRDTSEARIIAKAKLTDSVDAGSLSDLLRTLSRKTKVTGRTEIQLGNLGLSIVNPEKYRYEVISAIAADVKKLRESFADSFEIVVTGLDGRLQWQRSSVSEVDLYLGVSYHVYPKKALSVIHQD